MKGYLSTLPISWRKPIFGLATLFLLLQGLLLSTEAFAQPAFYPTDNAYLSRYPASHTPQHWTDSLRWTTIVDGGLRANLVVGGNVDSLVFDTIVNYLSSIGGGVLFFDQGVYNFNFNVELPSGVILRGADVPVSALDTTFLPLTKFQFPLYVPTFSGNGTPNNTAFKTIGGRSMAKNIGLVNIDVNGASIAFHPHQWTLVNTRRGNSYQPVDANRNVLVLGVRSNNTATPDPAVPSLCQQQNNGAWQRWVWSFSANIDLFVSANGIVANCRLNDDPTMTFLQPNYFYGDGTSCTQSPLCTPMAADGSNARFDVTGHYGIVVNRAKINRDGVFNGNFGTGINSPYGIYAWITYGEPDTEPYLFVNGVEIKDNWMFKTNRIGIQAAGNGLKVLNNKILDRIGKQVWISPNGTRCNVNNAATFENRGIDVSGWNVQVSYNNVMVESAVIRSGPFQTVDGEGILVQECCGGSSVKDYTFTHNLMQRGHSGYIGLYAMRDLINARIDSNLMGCENILYLADYAGTPLYFKIQNGSIKGNVEAGSISVTGTAGGSSMVVEGNVACSAATISGPCYMTVNNNTNYTVNNCTTTPTLTFPALSITNPTNGTTLNTGRTALVEWTSQDSDSVRLWVNANVMLPWTPASTTQFSWIPPGAGTYYLTVEGRNGSTNGWSSRVKVSVEDTLPITSLSPLAFGRSVGLAPNPATNQFEVLGLDPSSPAEIVITSLTGKQLIATKLAAGQGTQTDITTLSSGLYMVRISQGGNTTVLRLVRR